MSESGISSSQISAAGAYARADTLVATLPVRAIDPTRPRFQMGDEVAGDEKAAKARPQGEAADATDADGTAGSFDRTQERPATGWGRTGFGLLGAFTSFLARVFSQSDAGQVTAGASLRSGLQAYARAAGTSAADETGGAEILPPSFPRLASGRRVDLTV
ncbi:MAG: hypothetical protein NVV74_25465 [Magnetospirillum sp.]|nr:hypothetical protein [Magnetospirillum sp.]